MQFIYIHTKCLMPSNDRDTMEEEKYSFMCVTFSRDNFVEDFETKVLPMS